MKTPQTWRWPAALPARFDPAHWREHACAQLETWLVQDFAWRGRPLSAYIAAVDVIFGDAVPLRVWQSDVDSPVGVPPAGPTEDSDLLDAAQFDMWHPAWDDLVDHWYLTGQWLHPETNLQIDHLLFAKDLGSLLIGCLDRNDPQAPRRYDPRLPPDLHDIGVITFPLYPHRTLEYLAAGHTPETAMLLCAGTAVAAAAIHESLELFQQAPGRPVLDPHDSQLEIQVRSTWFGEDALRTDGYATA
ncbi:MULTISPECIES: hypothetical protein [unclassified Crossiella]|uniref:hypothetical protein n=1 Tax=unclassified Crossiella TaxID=2620835 RepID=UPI001FFF82D3|nr:MULTISPECIES: hypothetical protein [unclassified Crossiella]MCK2245431.1 hypothetical protein [Crossiella sp. S99.2]MCK2259083.1 hypothetical protein [Crossiella sp. S99.1]